MKVEFKCKSVMIRSTDSKWTNEQKKILNQFYVGDTFETNHIVTSHESALSRYLNVDISSSKREHFTSSTFFFVNMRKEFSANEW